MEVLRGPNALLNGFSPYGAISGAINIIPKRATGDFVEYTQSFASRSTFTEHVDVSRRWGDSKEWGVRINVLQRDGGGSVSGYKNDVTAATIGLDYQGDRFRAALDLGYQRQRPTMSLGGYSIEPGVRVPSASLAPRNYLQEPWEYGRTDDTYGMLRAEYDLTDSITAYGTIGGRHSTAQFLGSGFDITDNALNGYKYPYYNENNRDTLTGEVGLRGKFDTGPVRHDWRVSASALTIHQDYLYAWDFPETAANLLSNVPAPRPNYYSYIGTAPHFSTKTFSGLAVADTMSVWDGRVQFTAGVREQRVHLEQFDSTTGAKSSNYDESRLSPAFGLVVKPWQNVSFYANYI